MAPYVMGSLGSAVGQQVDGPRSATPVHERGGGARVELPDRLLELDFERRDRPRRGAVLAGDVAQQCGQARAWKFQHGRVRVLAVP